MHIATILDEVFPSAANPTLRSDLRRPDTEIASRRQQELEAKARQWLDRMRLGETAGQIGADCGVSKQYVSQVLNKFYDRETLAQACQSRVSAKHTHKLQKAFCANCEEPLASLDGRVAKFCSRQCQSDALSKHKAKIAAMQAARKRGKTWPEIAAQFGFGSGARAISLVKRYEARAANRVAPGINTPIRNTEVYQAVRRKLNGGSSLAALAQRCGLREQALSLYFAATRMKIAGAAEAKIAETLRDPCYESRVEAVRRVLQTLYDPATDTLTLPKTALRRPPGEVRAEYGAMIDAISEWTGNGRRWSGVDDTLGFASGTANRLWQILRMRVEGTTWPEIIERIEPGHPLDSFQKQFYRAFRQAQACISTGAGRPS